MGTLGKVLAAAGVALLAGGCASMTEPVRPCCYSGDYAMSRLDDVSLALDDGRRVRFREVFPGFQPSEGIIARTFPFGRVDIALVVYGALVPVLPGYDANGNGWLEEPEIAVLYVREAARGLGQAVDHVDAGSRTGALVLSRADVGGLVRTVEARTAEMSPPARAIFAEIEMLGRDLRTRGSENDGRDPARSVVPPS